MVQNRTLVHIRERPFLDLLDLALVVVRHRPLAVGLTATLGIAPWAALLAWLSTRSDVEDVVLLIFVALVAPWATAPLTVMLGGLMFGERPRAGRILTTVGKGLPAMLLYQGLLRFPLVTCLVILSPLIPVRLAFLNEVILLERARGGERNPQSVYRRCATLCGDRGAELFGQWLLLIGFSVLFVVCLRWASETAVDALIEDWAWDVTAEDQVSGFFSWLVDLRSWSTQLGLWIAVGFFGVVRFLSYIDQRIRLEGWEVELRLRAAGAALEDAE